MTKKDPKRTEKKAKRKAMAEFKELNEQIQKQMYADQFAQFVAANMGYTKGTYEETGKPITYPSIKSNITGYPYEINTFTPYNCVNVLTIMSAKLFGIALNPSMDKAAKILCAQMLDHVVFASQIIMANKEINSHTKPDQPSKSPWLSIAAYMLYVHALQYTLYMEHEDGKRLYEDVMAYNVMDFKEPPADFYEGLKKEMTEYFIPFASADTRDDSITKIHEQIVSRIKLMYDNYNKVVTIAPVEQPAQEEITEDKE